MTEPMATETQPYVTLEIGRQRLPATMVASHLRADLARTMPRPALSRRFRARLVMVALLAVVVPLVGVTRNRNAA
jgi:hypothetical protein